MVRSPVPARRTRSGPPPPGGPGAAWPPPGPPPLRGEPPPGRWPDRCILLAGLLAPAILAAVVLFVLVQAGSGGWAGLWGREWQPLGDRPRFGALPLLAGTGAVTALALAVTVPAGIGAALWLVALAPPVPGRALAALLRLMAAVPSVVWGLAGRGIVGPLVQDLAGARYPQSALAAGLTLALMLLPTFTLLAADSLRSVPSPLVEAALALGATRWETLTRVVLPWAAPGVVGAALLALGRGMGETMAMVMVAGSVPSLPPSLLEPVETVTAAIAWEMGEALAGQPHYQALYRLALGLLVASLALSAAAARLRRAVAVRG